MDVRPSSGAIDVTKESTVRTDASGRRAQSSTISRLMICPLRPAKSGPPASAARPTFEIHNGWGGPNALKQARADIRRGRRSAFAQNGPFLKPAPWNSVAFSRMRRAAMDTPHPGQEPCAQLSGGKTSVAAASLS